MDNKIFVKIKKLSSEAVIPSYAHNGDVGMDMTAIRMEYDPEKDVYIYYTDLAFESDFNVGQFLFVRSSNSKTDAYLTNHVGIADSAIYRGGIQFRFKNRESLKSMINGELIKRTIEYRRLLDPKEMETIEQEYLERAKNLEFAPYKVGDRIGQMVFLNYPTVELIITEKLSDSERGTGGFGSTGN